MNEIFNIAFAGDRGELKWFTLSSTSLKPISVVEPDSSGRNDHSNKGSVGADPRVGPHPEPVAEPCETSAKQGRSARFAASNPPETVTEPDLSGRSARLKSPPNILILPTTAGLPFQIELSFNDPVKITRVIPQMVADQYPEVTPSWLFSWNISAIKVVEPDSSGRNDLSNTVPVGSYPRPETVTEPCEASAKQGRSARFNTDNITNQQPQKYLVSGIAFPPEFAPARLAPDIEWRLALPDFLFASVTERSALHLKTPLSDYIALFSGANQLQRVIADSSLPLRPLLAAARIKSVDELDISDDAPALFATIQRLVLDSNSFDLSGFQQQLMGKTLRWAFLSAATLVLGLIFIWHFFLWFECRLTEAAADRTRISLSQAFSQVFPGVPVVDATSQTKRQVSLARNSLEEAGSIPNVPWIDLMHLASLAAENQVALSRLQSRADGFRFQGLAKDYTSLEQFRQKLEATGLVEKVSTPESRKSGDEVAFTLEAKWKS